MFSPMMVNTGTMNRMSRLAKRMPVAKLMAIGIINCAVVLVSKIKGIRPSDVVAVVRKIGLKRRSVASTMASSIVCMPSAINLL